MNFRRIFLGLTLSGALLVGAPTAALASTHAAVVKSGSACTKKQLDKTTKSGKTTYICKMHGKKYEWVVK